MERHGDFVMLNLFGFGYAEMRLVPVMREEYLPKQRGWVV